VRGIINFASHKYKLYNMFTKADLKQLEKKNIPVRKIEEQLENFRRGFPFAELVSAATPGHGIRVLSEEEVDAQAARYESRLPDYSVCKMVPASGAASRMFKSLLAYAGSERPKMTDDISEFIERIRGFAFFPLLAEKLEHAGHDIGELLEKKEYKTIIRFLLSEEGLNYAAMPKGLLLFHRYPEAPRTPLEEHMHEGTEYSRDPEGVVHIHFTVSPEHRPGFEGTAALALRSGQFAGDISFDINYSEQKPSTDTIAVDPDNQPFRDRDGSLLFRPGGHGALIENLNELDHEIVFIKNIDNVVPDHLRQPTYRYKKALGGLLIHLMEKTHAYLDALTGREPDTTFLEEVITFASRQLMIEFPGDFSQQAQEKQIKQLYNLLNRPIRICGMVKNEGEPGGGPFWVRDREGNVSLQIVESSQIDMKDKEQAGIVRDATHFNPVDLVCSLKDFQGNTFDLSEYIDPGTGFISTKSKDGRELKAQELPGLWNGAMAKWNTIFVEVPIETFNPVKTVNDLLRPQHQ
jgi:hypothetical protein